MPDTTSWWGIYNGVVSLPEHSLRRECSGLAAHTLETTLSIRLPRAKGLVGLQRHAVRPNYSVGTVSSPLLSRPPSTMSSYVL